MILLQQIVQLFKVGMQQILLIQKQKGNKDLFLPTFQKIFCLNSSTSKWIWTQNTNAIYDLYKYYFAIKNHCKCWHDLHNFTCIDYLTTKLSKYFACKFSSLYLYLTTGGWLYLIERMVKLVFCNHFYTSLIRSPMHFAFSRRDFKRACYIPNILTW